MATSKNIKINLDYSNFTGGIKECQSKMNLLNQQFKMQQAELGNNATEVDKLTLAESALTQKIALQEQVVQQSLSRWEAMVNSEDATLQQTEKAHAAFIKQRTALYELNNELENVQSKLEETGNAEEELSSTSNTLASSNDKVNSSFLSTISTVSSVISAMRSAINVIDDMARSAAGSADDIETMATKYGVASQTLDQWSAIAGLTDVSVETLGSSMSKLTRQMSSAASGSDSAIAKFSQLGITVTDSNGSLRNTEAVFYDVIDALNGMDNVAERDAAAMDLLGKSAQELNPIINMGSEAFRELAESSQGVIPDGMEGRLSDLQDSFDSFDVALERGSNLLVGAFAPAISGVLDWVSNLDPSILAVVSAYGMLFQIVSSVAPVLTTLRGAMAMEAAAEELATVASLSDAGAKQVEAAATEVATAANTGFIASLVAAAPAIVEIVLSIAAMAAAFAAVGLAIAAVIAAIALLADAIAALISLFQVNKEVTDAATESIRAYSGEAKSITTASASASSNTSYMASGSTYGGAGGLTWVGEQGAELVNLPQGSTVYNHEDSTSMSTSSVSNFYVTIDAKNVNDFNKVVQVFNGLDQSMNRGGLVNG